MMKKTAITLGDPNSISPEIIIKALNSLDMPAEQIVLVGNKCIFDYYESNLNLKLKNKYEIISIPFNESDIKIGEMTKEAGEFSFTAIQKACELANNNEISAIVTGPVSKYVMHLSGYKYPGQTEIIEKLISQNNQKGEMLFVSDKLRVFLLTRHISLRDVPESINRQMIIDKTKTLYNSLTTYFNIKSPRIALCALNPHSGEMGILGTEEITKYIPAIEDLKKENINIEGPFSADALFANLAKSMAKTGKPQYDCYITGYHDQGLIPIKMLGWDNAVNTTIGLNILRTSPVHGTAFDIAGKNIASENSMISAIKIALSIQ